MSTAAATHERRHSTASRSESLGLHSSGSSTSSASSSAARSSRRYGTFETRASTSALETASGGEAIGRPVEADPINASMAGNGKDAARPATQADAAKVEDSHKDKWHTVKSWLSSKDLTLNNVGSVARDHLANERTFLAWLRTSVSLASIGVAITQLFRLSASQYTLPSNPSTPTSSATLPTTTATINQAELPNVVAALLIQVQQLTTQLDELGSLTTRERTTYHRLGKPIGGTFLMLGLVFLFLGANRYLSVQHHLASKNFFPPARRSVLITASCMGALLIAAFVSILVIQ